MQTGMYMRVLFQLLSWASPDYFTESTKISIGIPKYRRISHLLPAY